MLVVTSQDARNLANSYLVAECAGGAAILVDGGTPTAPIHAAVAEHRLQVEGLFITHRHPDHIGNVAEYVERYGIPTLGHREEAQDCGGFHTYLEGGEVHGYGELQARALHIPGHTAGHLAVVVSTAEEMAVFTGDTLFRGSVGGTLGAGHTTLDDLRRSILDVLLELPGECVVYPGHTEPTTVEEERRTNAFVRAWRGDDPVQEVACLANGEPAALLLRAKDYDGGTKCWVRLPDGREAVVPGSRVFET
jgi:hydroxyacylglutathione hydrolase